MKIRGWQKKNSRRYNRKTSTFKESHDFKLDMVKICKDFLCMKLKTHKTLINTTGNRITCKLYRMSYIVLEILQARLQQYLNRELPDVQAGFRKGNKQEIKLPIRWIIKKARVPEKHLLLLH